MNNAELLLLVDREFPLTSEISYLNHAAVAPWPKRTADAVIQFATENSQRGAQNYPQWMKNENHLRQKLKTLVGARSTDEIALTKSTSEALSFVAYGLTWQQGDEIVICDQEFPSNRIIWESLSNKFGVKIVIVSLGRGITPEEAIVAALTSKTRLVSVSSVQYGTGLKLDLQLIGCELRRRHILFCVDAIQSVGICTIDVESAAIDFLMADGHKWMLGPEGLALFYIREEHLGKLNLSEYGWHMVRHRGDYSRDTWEIADNATRFECGSPNMLAAHALNASLSLILEVGVETIASRIKNHMRYLSNELAEITGLEFITDLSEDRTAGIITFAINSFNAEKLQRLLTEKGVICACRGGGIRFSPHFYTSHKTLDNAVNYLKECINVLSN